MPKFTTSDGLSLHFTDQGAGLPVLCLSGLTRNGTDFDYVVPHLGDVRLIRMDYRGRGQSDWDSDFLNYNVMREGQDAIELLDHLGIERAAILGTSRGGIISMILASTHRDRLSGICLVDIGPELETEGLDVIMGYLGRNPVWKTLDEAQQVIGTRMAGFDGVPMSRWRQEVEKHFIEGPDGLTINYDPKLRDAVLAATSELAPDLWPLLGAMADMPTACIRGANSDLLGVGAFARMQEMLPQMIAATVPNRGHVPFLDEPESLAAIRAWVGQLQ